MGVDDKVTTKTTLDKKLTTIDNKLTTQPSRLEDFGIRGAISPHDRFKEYQAQAKGLSKMFQAKFWLAVLEYDPDVRKLLELKEKNGRRRY